MKMILFIFASCLAGSISSAEIPGYFTIGYEYHVQAIGSIAVEAGAADDTCALGNGRQDCQIGLSNINCKSKEDRSQCQITITNSKGNPIRKLLKAKDANALFGILKLYTDSQCKDGMCEIKVRTISCGYTKGSSWGKCDAFAY